MTANLAVSRAPNLTVLYESRLNVDCHVLEDGRRVFSQRGALALLKGKTGEATPRPKQAHLGRYLDRLPEKYRLSTPAPNIEFEANGGIGHGLEAVSIVAICQAYAKAHAAGALTDSP